MSTRAHWAREIPDLYGDLSQARHYLTLAEVSDRCQISPNTLKDVLSRPIITATSNPMSALSRPAYRIANKPLYSKEQVKRYLALRDNDHHRHLGGGSEPLPVVTPKEAERAELMSTMEIADYAGVHEQTVRRWAREVEAWKTGPVRAVALRSRDQGHPGVPIVVREKSAVRDWLRNYVEHNSGKRVEKIANHLRRAHGMKLTVGGALRRQAS